MIAGGLCLVMLVGAGWLLAELGAERARYAPMTAGPMAPADLAAAAALAEEWGIDHRIKNARLYVEPSQLDRLRLALCREGRSDAARPVSFERLAADADIWATRAQHDKRWQAAKMAELSRLISAFPPVLAATVIIEPGNGPGLGRRETKPRAAVQIDLARGSRVTGRLVDAIADLVSGSVQGMDAADVRIVDSSGRSYRAGEPVAADAEDIARLRRLAEEYYAAKAREAVAYVAGAIVGVTVECDPADDANASLPGRCIAATISVPRSYLAAAYRTRAGSEETDANDAELDAAAGDILRRVRCNVATAVGLTREDGEAPETVQADWYYDPWKPKAGTEPLATSPDGATRQEARPARSAGAWAAPLGILAAIGVCAGLAAWVRIRRRAARIAASGPRATKQDSIETAAPRGSDESADPLARLAGMDPPRVAAMLADEHPQTQALVLSRVSPDTAAEVLEALGPERQVEVTRRIAALAAVDPVVAAEAVRGLIEQWSATEALVAREEGQGPAGQADTSGAAEAQSVAPPATGVSAAARILHRADAATEQAVMDGLSGMAPGLAESIRKRMFVFDDVALLPRTVLRAALDALGSDELAIALRTAGPGVTEKVLSSLGRDAAAKVRREMERIGPVRLSDVEAAQERVVSAVRRLEDGTYASGADRKQSELIA